jgi:hypothetical protein
MRLQLCEDYVFWNCPSFSSLAKSFVNSKEDYDKVKTKRRLCPRISTFFPKVLNRFPVVSKDSQKITVCIKRFPEDYGM